MTHTDIATIAALLLMGMFLVVPMLARSWMALAGVVIGFGIVVGFLWLQTFAGDEPDGVVPASAISGYMFAMGLSIAWIAGSLSGATRILLRKRGSTNAGHGVPPILIISIVLTAALLWIM